MKRAAIYARSPFDTVLAAQIALCKHYAEEMGYTIEEQHIYQDALSGRANPLEREHFKRLCDAASQFDVVLVTNPARLSLNNAMVQRVKSVLEQAEVEIIFVDWRVLEQANRDLEGEVDPIYARQSTARRQDHFSRLFEAAEQYGFNLALMIRLDQTLRESTAVQNFLETLAKQGVKIITLE